MNPISVYKFDSKAEEKLFPVFKRAKLETATAYHSLNIPKHEKKQFAEADFVVVSSRGVLVLEVKGGRLSVKQGIWYTKDGDNKTERLKESPVDQVKSARFALENLLGEKNLNINLNKVNFGFGVMFPDIKLGNIGVELTKEMVFDAIDWDRKNLVRWLEKLYRYWVERTGKSERLTEIEVAELCSALREEFDKEKSLLAEVGESWEQMISLTKQQYMVVDLITANKQVIIEGGAGTGKTLVAVKACREMDAMGHQVLFICRSPVLTSFLRARLKETQVQVMNFTSLKEKVDCGDKLTFSALVVDEGQDMLDMESIEILDSLFDGGMSNGRWYFFMDPNNQGSLYAKQDPDALEYLSSSGYKLPLKRNCRNTLQIAKHTLFYTGGDIGQCQISSQGLPVIEKNNDYETREHLIELVEKQLIKWIDEEDVQLGDITLISPLAYEQSVASQLDKRWRRKITVINENFGERWLDTALTFSTIRDFKGLENKYVMLLDLSEIVGHEEGVNELYVAMTRANSVLWMSIPSNKRTWFNERGLENVTAVSEYVRINNGK